MKYRVKTLRYTIFRRYIAEISRHFLPWPLVGSTNVLESERHGFGTVQPLRCNKGYFLLIRLEHGDLVVSGEGI